MVTILFALAIGYVLGSIASGVWAGRIFKRIDIRQHGSGSTGATNVFRVLGTKLAVAVLLVDIAKGFFSCFLASKVSFGDTLLSANQLALIAGVAAIIGHLFPLFAGFKGGKGVATGAGMLLFLAPLELAFALVVFVATLAITRYVSLGSILAAAFFSLSILIQKYVLRYPSGNEMAALAIFVLLLILLTHRSNIRRLIKGQENKLGAHR